MPDGPVIIEAAINGVTPKERTRTCPAPRRRSRHKAGRPVATPTDAAGMLGLPATARQI
ncbi:MAG TPA: hypothetical protein VFH58_08925 [Acidimicrobiales bacterium]|nr:hypothetical protein [Acidimicrobiales bacterium]